MYAEFPSCRLVLTLMGVLASVNCYTLRVNLSVTLVVMINNTWIEQEAEGTAHHVHHISPCVPDLPNKTVVEVRNADNSSYERLKLAPNA